MPRFQTVQKPLRSNSQTGQPKQEQTPKTGRWTQKSPTGDTNEQAKQTQDTPGTQDSQPSVPKQEATERLYLQMQAGVLAIFDSANSAEPNLSTATANRTGTPADKPANAGPSDTAAAPQPDATMLIDLKRMT